MFDILMDKGKESTMNKKELTLLYNRLTAMTYDIEEDINKVDELKLVHLLEEVATALDEIIEG